ncbi:GntR family transcriptional regulator [Hamadaea tsunoensis]|uniref:GntR family transcriptional regulator n=1 Tax=Hamadaea tsunoensis TaxID=53368 RepID=UPI001FE051FC|nr:GntR family transcriptional regulator [Hamadaea tsunoensis]
MSEPLWAETAQRVLDRAAADGLTPGRRLPGERDLCQELGVSRVTLRRALTHLLERGLVSSAHGRGWYLASPPATRDWPQELESFTVTARRKGMRARSDVVRHEVRPATHDEGDRLRVPAGTPLVDLERVRHLNDIRVAHDRTLIPEHLSAGLTAADFRTASLFEMLTEAGVRLGRSVVSIEARAASAAVAGYLDIAAGSPILVLDQVIHTAGGDPALLSTVQYVGDRYRLRTTFTPAF